MYRFMHVGFTFPGVPKVRDLEPVFLAMGDDWIRYSLTSWIMWTEKPAAEIYIKLRSHIDSNDQVLITKLDLTDSCGSVSLWIWTWINNKGALPIIAVGKPVEDAMQKYLSLPKPIT